MITEVNTDVEQLDAKSSKVEQEYQQCIDSAKKYLQSGDLEKARHSLNSAKMIKDTPEVRELLDTVSKKQIEKAEYDSIRESPTLAQYLKFVAKYPNSTYIPDLRRKLVSLEKNLPPEKYWRKGINKNVKRYYEYTFGNGHIMIYIPGQSIWIDKYEVSWRQFKAFDNNYINKDDGYPAMVRYSEAEGYCRNNGLRIPTHEEWKYAASANMNLEYPYPWSKDAPDTDGIYRANFDTLDAGKDKDGYPNTAPVRSFEEFSSPFGVVNMAGNIWEWVQGRVLKGGGYLSSSEEDLRIAAPSRGGDNGRQGFRCVKDEKR